MFKTIVLIAVLIISPNMAWGQSRQLWQRCDGTAKNANLDDALSVCSRILKIKKLSKRRKSDAYRYRGDVYSARDDLARALADYSKAIELNPRNDGAYTGRGLIYKNRSDYARAIADFTKSMELTPRNVSDVITRGNTYNLCGQHNDAIVDFNRALKMKRTAYATKLVYLGRGRAHASKGQYDRAIMDFTRVIEAFPEDGAAYMERGNTYVSKGDLGLAIVDITKATKIAPQNPYGFRRLAIVMFNSGDFKGAAYNFRHAVKLNSNVYSMLLLYISRTRIGENAQDELKENIASLKTKKWPHAIAELYLGKRSWSAVLDGAATPDERCEARFYIGQLHLVMSRKNDAVTSLNLAKETCPKSFIEFELAVAEIERLKQ